jgi:hypothetical protein
MKLSATTYTYGGSNNGNLFQVDNNTIIVSARAGGNGFVALTMAFPGTTAPAAGKYRIVASGATLQAGQTSFIVNNGNSNTAGYESTGSGGVDAIISINNNKYAIVIPETEVTPLIGTGANTTFSADVAQQ